MMFPHKESSGDSAQENVQPSKNLQESLLERFRQECDLLQTRLDKVIADLEREKQQRINLEQEVEKLQEELREVECERNDLQFRLEKSLEESHINKLKLEKLNSTVNSEPEKVQAQGDLVVTLTKDVEQLLQKVLELEKINQENDNFKLQLFFLNKEKDAIQIQLQETVNRHQQEIEQLKINYQKILDDMSITEIKLDLDEILEDSDEIIE